MSQNVTTAAPVEFLRAGLYLFAEGERTGARRLFRACVEAAPLTILAWNNLAMAEIACGAPEAGIAALQRSLALDQSQLNTWVSLASALLQTGALEASEAACRHALALQPECGSAWHLLGIVMMHRQDYQRAAPCLATAITYQAPDAALLASLGQAQLHCGRLTEAAAAFRDAARLDPAREAASGMAVFTAFVERAAAGDSAGAFALYDPPPADVTSLYMLAVIYLERSGHQSAALAVAEGWLVRHPADEEAQHRCQILRDPSLARIPADVVAHRFDAYADRFDQHLVGALHYDVPAMVGRRVEAWAGARRDLVILDLGCGTGLCGPHLRRFARFLAGVDLSPRMIGKAAELKLYDHLSVDDLLVTLTTAPAASYDLIVAADVLVYMGELRVVFEEAARSLRPDGRFLFSVERGVEQRPYTLLGGSRFAHAEKYLRDLAARIGASLELTPIVVRREGAADVAGLLGVLQADADRKGPVAAARADQAAVGAAALRPVMHARNAS